MNSHREADKLVCYICGMTYKSKAALDVHVGMHQVRFLTMKFQIFFWLNFVVFLFPGSESS